MRFLVLLAALAAVPASAADVVKFDWFEHTGRDSMYNASLPHAKDDGSILSNEVAGGFVGTVLGPFARQE